MALRSGDSCGLEEAGLDLTVGMTRVTCFLLQVLFSLSVKGASGVQLSHRCNNTGEIEFVSYTAASCRS